MKAAVLFEAKKPLEICDVTIDKPGPHEVLIRTAACGVCRSDLHFVDGAYPTPLPAIPGHEAAGIVEAVGDEVRTVKVGDAVVTAQPSKAARSSGMSGSIATQACSCTSIISA